MNNNIQIIERDGEKLVNYEEHKREVNIVLDALQTILHQVCYKLKEREYNSRGVDKYAQGLKTLEKYGRIHIISEHHTKIIAKDI